MAGISCFFHPHHVSLIDTHSFRAKLQHAGDPYYNIDGLPSHKHVLAPKFDILEKEDAYLLVGEIPGVKGKEHISFEWLEDQTLFVRGDVDSREAEEKGDDIKRLHMERHVGKFERSFTLPSKVDPKSLAATVEDGLLKISLRKIGPS
jgi:HSP20 family protein